MEYHLFTAYYDLPHHKLVKIIGKTSENLDEAKRTITALPLHTMPSTKKAIAYFKDFFTHCSQSC